MCIRDRHVTPEALVKARFLRDATLARVVFMVGGVQPRWLDLGAPRTTDEETWHETTAAFLSAHE